MAAKQVNIRCPECNAPVRLELGFWHFGKQKCPKCGKGIPLKQKGMQAMRCPSCENDVMYPASEGEESLCPVCNRPLFAGKTIEVVCPECGIVNRVPADSKDAECVICKHRFTVADQTARAEAAEDERAYVIKGPSDPNAMIWQHPLDAFPYRSRLIVSEGMWALCLQNGECRYPVGPGSYPLNESPLKGEQRFDAAVNGEETVFSTQVFFVRSRIPHAFLWGTPTAIRLHDADGEAEARMSGRLNVNVVDPKAFAGLTGYRSQSLDELTRTMGDSPESESPLVSLLRHTVCQALEETLQPMVDSRGWKLSALSGRTAEIAQEVRARMDMELDVRGLQVDQLVIQQLRCDETAESKANREKNAEKLKRRETLLRQVERWLDWSTEPIAVHMKDNPTLSAEITLGGGVNLRLTDPERLMERPAAREWLEKGASDADVAKFFTGMINNLLMNALFDVLQPMIDDTGADVRELGRYFGYLRSSMSDTLNQALFEWGLRVENFSLQQRRLEKSAALAKLTQMASYKSESLIEKEMQAFTRSLELDNAAADSDHRVQLRGVNSREYSAMTDLDLADARTADQAADVTEELTIKKMAREERLRRYQKDLQNAHEDDDDDRRQQKALRGLDNAAEIESRKRQIAANARQSGFDESYADWQRQSRLEDEKFMRDLRTQELRQDAAIQTSRRAAEARRADERDNLEQRRMMSDIVRKIEQSNLDWQQKLDAYERLKRNTDADDGEARQVSSARAEADASYVREHLKLTLSREENDFLEEQAQRADAREERRQQLEHAREMEARQNEIALQMELLRMEHDQQEKADAAQQRIREQEMEIDKLKLMMSHYERMAELRSRDAAADRSADDRRTSMDMDHELDKLRLTLGHEEAMGRQNVDAIDILSGADAVRAKVDREYAERYAQRDQEAEQARRAAREQREDQYADRAEALLKQMWSIQSSLKSLELENDREYLRGRAEADKAEAKRRRSDMDELIHEVQKLAKKIDGKVAASKAEADGKRKSLVDKLSDAAREAEADKERKLESLIDRLIVKSDTSTSPFMQTRDCPLCGKQVYVGTTICPFCGNPIQ